MIIFVDIDGTLTNGPNCKYYETTPNIQLQSAVAKLIANGNEVIIWSRRGTKYAEDFCKLYQLKPKMAIGKPDFIIDDGHTILYRKLGTFHAPEKLLKL